MQQDIIFKTEGFPIPLFLFLHLENDLVEEAAAILERLDHEMVTREAQTTRGKAAQ